MEEEEGEAALLSEPSLSLVGELLVLLLDDDDEEGDDEGEEDEEGMMIEEVDGTCFLSTLVLVFPPWVLSMDLMIGGGVTINSGRITNPPIGR